MSKIGQYFPPRPLSVLCFSGSVNYIPFFQLLRPKASSSPELFFSGSLIFYQLLREHGIWLQIPAHLRKTLWHSDSCPCSQCRELWVSLVRTWTSTWCHCGEIWRPQGPHMHPLPPHHMRTRQCSFAFLCLMVAGWGMRSMFSPLLRFWHRICLADSVTLICKSRYHSLRIPRLIFPVGTKSDFEKYSPDLTVTDLP